MRSHTDMNEDLANIIRRALDEARAVGRDYIGQTELAMRAVREVRPDMTASEALTAGAWVRPKGSIDPRVKKLVSAIRGA